MKNKTRPFSDLKSTGNTIMSSKKEKDLLLMNDIQKTPGNGLWCVNIKSKIDEKLSTQSTTKTKNVISSISPNSDVDLEIEKKIISQLRFQVQDLTSKLNSALCKCAEAEYRASRAENKKQNYIENFEQKECQIKEFEEKIDQYENTIINLNEALSNAKKEILRLQSENNDFTEKTEKYYSLYQSLLIDKERKESSMSTEITNLMLKLQIIMNEKENLIRTMRVNNQNSNETYSFQKLIDEKEITIKNNECNLNKLINENLELKRKITYEENFKAKLNEIIKKKKEKISRLKEELKSYKDGISQYTNEVKWNQEMVLQRDNQIKVFKEKIKKLEEEIKNLKDKNKKVKSTNIPVEENIYEQENICQVIPKPFLFGPEIEEPHIY